MGRSLAVLEGQEPLGRDGVALASSPVLLEKVNEPDATPSWGEVSPREQGWNAAAFRRSFPEIWGQYLKDRYKTAYAVRKAFPGIDGKTARDWIGGKRDPHASFVIAEVTREETALQALSPFISPNPQRRTA
jgi:hypothetical protein